MTQKRNAFFRLLDQSFGMDQAVLTTVTARAASSLAGIVTIASIAHYLTPKQQGYYYTLSSLIALQYVFELGFSSVILQLASHERATLEIKGGDISGDVRAHSRLASILQRCVRHYVVMVAVMAACVLPAGIYFFKCSQPTDGEWLLPWCAVVLAASSSFVLTPLYSFLEGCGFVLEISRVRLAQILLSAISSWSCLMLHHGLFAPAALLVGQAICGGIWLHSKRQLLFGLWRYERSGQAVSWRTEVWPFQWRIAVTWLSGYFIVQLLNPILFALQGPIVAGQMGMSLAVATSAGNLALAWMTTKAAPFGMMVARRQHAQLDAAFHCALKHSFTLLCILCTCILMVELMLGKWAASLQSRFLPPFAFALLLATTALTHITFSQAVYLRAHKQERLFTISVASALLVVFGTLILGRFSSIAAVMASYFVAHGLLYAVAGQMIFTRTRQQLAYSR